MKEDRIKKINLVGQWVLTTCIFVVSVALIASQYFLLDHSSSINLSLVARIEGEELGQFKQEVKDEYLVGELNYQVYNMAVDLGEGILPEKENILVYINHRLVGNINQGVKNFAVTKNQIVELDCTKVTQEYEVIFTFSDEREAFSVMHSVTPGLREVVEWQQEQIRIDGK